MKRIFSILTVVNTAVLVALAICFGVYVSKQAEKKEIVYVDNIKLFNEFNMSKDLSKEHNAKITSQTKKVDSIYRQFQAELKAKDEEAYKITQQHLQREDQELGKLKNYLANEVSQHVWGRINTHLQEFGKENNYRIVIGANGSGNLMYGEEGVDVTTAALLYINGKYEGE